MWPLNMTPEYGGSVACPGRRHGLRIVNPGRAAIHQAMDFTALYQQAWTAQTGGEPDRAADLYRQILRQAEQPQAWLGLGQLALDAGRKAEALEHFRRAQGLLPQSGAIRHMVDMLAQEQVPDRAPDDYVLWVFDGHAESFEAHLAALKYQGPEMIARLVGDWIPRKSRQILDLGCGTGRNGPLFRPHAARLDGVDLAPRMLQVTARTRLYDHLYRAEAHAFLARPPVAYDTLLATDVFIYIGRLERIFASAAANLAPAAEMLFTIELGDGSQPVQLMPTGRFRQSDAYIRELATAHGFTVAAVLDDVLRVEQAVPEQGRAYRLTRS